MKRKKESKIPKTKKSNVLDPTCFDKEGRFAFRQVWRIDQFRDSASFLALSQVYPESGCVAYDVAANCSRWIAKELVWP